MFSFNFIYCRMCSPTTMLTAPISPLSPTAMIQMMILGEKWWWLVHLCNASCSVFTSPGINWLSPSSSLVSSWYLVTPLSSTPWEEQPTTWFLWPTGECDQAVKAGSFASHDLYLNTKLNHRWHWKLFQTYSSLIIVHIEWKNSKC